MNLFQCLVVIAAIMLPIACMWVCRDPKRKSGPSALRASYALRYKYSKAWDDELVEAMQKYKFEPVYKYEARIGPFDVGVDDCLLCSFHPQYPGAPKVACSPQTQSIAWNKMMSDYMDAGRQDLVASLTGSPDALELEVRRFVHERKYSHKENQTLKSN